MSRLAQDLANGFRSVPFWLSLVCSTLFGNGLLDADDAPTPQAGLESQLLGDSPERLADESRTLGDARRGAIVFYRPTLACTTCHTTTDEPGKLGPNLARWPEKPSIIHIIESILRPSKVIRKGYEPLQIATTDGKVLTALLVEDRPESMVVRDVSRNGEVVTIRREQIDGQSGSPSSIMPSGLVSNLGSRQEFLDLVRYLAEIAENGPDRARDLMPPASVTAARPLPSYEASVDHAGMIRDLDESSFERGKTIYHRLCVNCHGTLDQPGSLPTSRRFATEAFKNGADPYSMYKTLTYGYGQMMPQTWMVPQQKYDVIHYIREVFLKDRNPTQYSRINDSYLVGLPKGTTRGPEAVTIEPWATMNYGPHLTATYEVGDDGSNFAYKGIAIRLDPGPGGVARGNAWMIFDEDTMRVAAAWTGEGFIDWNGVNFNGQHQVHPRIVGDLQFSNPTGPGWAGPGSDGFQDPRLRGRDNRPYGPLPRDWAHFRGLYHQGDRVVVSYSVGATGILESPGLIRSQNDFVFTRNFEVGRRDRDITLQVARHPDAHASFRLLDDGLAALETNQAAEPNNMHSNIHYLFDGKTYFEFANPDDFDLTTNDYSLLARIKTRRGGTIFSETKPASKWVHDGKALFVRGGRLVFDIGWVGAVTSRSRVDDDQWHDVAMTWNHEDGNVRLYVDGRIEGEGHLKPKQKVKDHVIRIGFASPDFPGPQSLFMGQIKEIQFHRSVLSLEDLAGAFKKRTRVDSLLARWNLEGEIGTTLVDLSGKGHDGTIQRPESDVSRSQTILAGLSPEIPGAHWHKSSDGDLRLTIPAGQETLRFTLWTSRVRGPEQATRIATSPPIHDPSIDLASALQGGPPHWPEHVHTKAIVGDDREPFAVDTLSVPSSNPWSCLVRPSGFDFLPGGDRAAVCTWDGDVWEVRGINQPEQGLTWRRIASGLFQPLGLKYTNGAIYVSCRDQICILRDLNGDGETDFYENFNNDHQVTDHFHEFAMDLQVDGEGNFYYTKAARHGLTALVPQHGTLLRVSKDGLRTDILATGFRAPNGVCLNPDGSFALTDQEGFWTPKNRINWVTSGRFYGNMWGYHDVTDTSDRAMEPPICWITNRFDRSPSELLWVNSDAWKPLKGSLLNFSYGYGKIYVVPHEKVDGQMQGGMAELPIPPFPTGVMRGRFHPMSGQLYTCGMFAWAGNQQQPGDFYRVRYTGKPIYVPVGLHAKRHGIQIDFSGPLDSTSTAVPANFTISTWALKRSAKYGSDHYDEQTLKVTSSRLLENGRSIFLEIPDIQPTWCMEIQYSIKTSDGSPIHGMIHNTIHHLANED